ncbi:hypothetical protein TWF696_004479 [Orbilia brochopaga]|uniref:Uncharacterized protein n=1 Tax=Orbilia brochopaga TaxID=3140254 RepID=A0AAV9V909_9PEZI
MALPSPTSQPAYPHQQGPIIPSSVFSSDRDLQELVNRRDMRISSTHDLAEFLRSSKPEDYSRPPKAADDLALDAGHRKISFKFLKTASKDLLSPRKNTIPVPVPSTTALPEKVRPEKTSKGNSYLAIQVDYTPAEDITLIPSVWTPSSSGGGSTRNSFQNTTFAECSSDQSNYRTSLSSQNFPSEYDTFSTPTDTRLMSRWMRNSSGSELSSPRAGLLASPTISQSPGAYTIAKSDRSVASLFPNKNVQIDSSIHDRMPPLSALPKPVSNLAFIQRRYSSDSTVRGNPVSSHSSRVSSRIQQEDPYLPTPSSISSSRNADNQSPVYVESKHKDAYSSLTSTPARPGPPPNRDLPSLPEGHGDAINLASKIRAAAAARTSISSQISLSSEVGSLKSRRAGTPNRTRSQRSQREMSVKARKIKDLEELRSRRSMSQSEGTQKPEQRTIKHKKSQSNPNPRRNNPKPDALTLAPITVVYEVAPDDGETEADNYCSDATPSAKSGSEMRQSVSSAASSEALPPQTRQSMDFSAIGPPSTPGSYVLRSSASAITSSTTNLEARMSYMERRNHLLEQALLAVLRSAICIDNGALMDNNGLTEIVKGLTNAPTPSYSQ